MSSLSKSIDDNEDAKECVTLLVESATVLSDSDCAQLGFKSTQSYVNTVENLIFDFIVKHSEQGNREGIIEIFIPLDREKAHFKSSFLQLCPSIESKQRIEHLYLGSEARFSIQYDVAYGEKTSVKHTFDIYRGSVTREGNSKQKLPVVLYFHGGAWLHGNKFSAIKRLRHFMDEGVIFLAVGYRLVDEALWPAQIEDAENVLKEVLENAETLGIDPQRIILWGSSAGGHLATLLASKFPQQVKGLINYCAPLSFDNHIESLSSEALEHSPIFHLLGGAHPELSRYAFDASPLNRIKKDALKIFPKTLIFHGKEDTTVPFSESQSLHDALIEKELDSQLIALENTGHRINDLETSAEIKRYLKNL